MKYLFLILVVYSNLIYGQYFEGHLTMKASSSSHLSFISMDFKQVSQDELYTYYDVAMTMKKLNGNQIEDIKNVKLNKINNTMKFISFFHYEGNCNTRYEFKFFDFNPSIESQNNIVSVIENKACICGSTCVKQEKIHGEIVFNISSF